MPSPSVASASVSYMPFTGSETSTRSIHFSYRPLFRGMLSVALNTEASSSTGADVSRSSDSTTRTEVPERSQSPSISATSNAFVIRFPPSSASATDGTRDIASVKAHRTLIARRNDWLTAIPSSSHYHEYCKLAPTRALPCSACRNICSHGSGPGYFPIFAIYLTRIQ